MAPSSAIRTLVFGFLVLQGFIDGRLLKSPHLRQTRSSGQARQTEESPLSMGHRVQLLANTQSDGLSEWNSTQPPGSNSSDLLLNETMSLSSDEAAPSGIFGGTGPEGTWPLVGPIPDVAPGSIPGGLKNTIQNATWSSVGNATFFGSPAVNPEGGTVWQGRTFGEELRVGGTAASLDPVEPDCINTGGQRRVKQE